MNAELRALTSMRGIAAWLVVFFHIRQSIAGLPGRAEAVLAKGYLAVDFFFLLSGFVIWLSWSERLRAGGIGAVPGFLQRRVARIWPLHAVMLAAGIALALALAATGRHPDQFAWGELPLHLLLLQNWGLTDSLHWNDPAWSISCELAAYLLFPLLALTIDWRRVPSLAILAALGVLLALLHGAFAARGLGGLGQDIPRMGLTRCLIEFGSGTALAALWLRWRTDWRMSALTASALGTAALAPWLASLAPETLAVPAGFAALLLALALSAGRPGNPLEVAPLHWLGEISYSTYLGHFLLWYAFKLALVPASGQIGWGLVALYLALVLAFSAALYHLIERPAQRRLNALRLPRIGARRPSPHAPSD